MSLQNLPAKADAAHNRPAKHLWNAAMQKALFALMQAVSRPAPESVSRRNYADNAKRGRMGTFIFDQGTKEVEAFRYGKENAGKSGCGPIAVYNALRLREKAPNLATLIDQFEHQKSLVLSGAFGTDPNSIPPVLSQYGIDVQTYRDFAGITGAMKMGDVAVMLIWNDRENVQKGVHYFTVQRAGNGYEAYNRYAGEKAPLQKRNLSEILNHSRYILGYLLR